MSELWINVLSSHCYLGTTYGTYTVSSFQEGYWVTILCQCYIFLNQIDQLWLSGSVFSYSIIYSLSLLEQSSRRLNMEEWQHNVHNFCYPLSSVCFFSSLKKTEAVPSFSRFILRKLIILWITICLQTPGKCGKILLSSNSPSFPALQKKFKLLIVSIFYWYIKYRNSTTFGLNPVLHLRDCFAHSELRYLVWYSGYMNPNVHSKTTELYW